MSEFFKGQYDYIYFFCGLAFFFLAIVCFSIGKDKRSKLRWVLLGLFSFTHGINEWLEIITISYSTSYIFSIAHLIVLGISYLFLFEFARAGFSQAGKKVIGLWIYPVIIALSFLGFKHGLGGLNVTVRYFLGFSAGLFSAWVIDRATKLEPEEKHPLIILSVTMVLYAVFTGLIVPEADFNPANWLNIDSFYRIFGLPAQFVRGILILLSAMALWFYPPALANVKFLPQKYFFPFKASKWMILLTLVVLIGLGWVFTNYLDYYAGIQLIKNSKANANSTLNQLIKELTKLERAAISISRSGPVKTALITRADKDTAYAASVIERYKERYENTDCFLLDDQGMTVISAGGDLSERIAAKSLASTPYFKQAMSGNTGYYFKLGPAYDERTYYVSFPVKGPDKKILGAVVIRKNISAAPILRYRLISISITMFVCVLAIIFFIVLRRRENLIKLIEKVNAQLNAVDTMKTDFVSFVSHELRTPLTSIKNAAGILLKGLPNNRISLEKEKELLEIILNNTDRQTRMVSDLLDVSKIEAGVMDMHIEPADIAVLAGEVVNSLQHYAEDKKISLIVFSDKESLTIPIDSEQTRRIFTNLIVNAIKFTPDNGEVTVKLKMTREEVRVSVSDTGIGISADDAKKIFDKFYRASDIRARRKGGSGLGLLITKGLVEAQGGKIWVESELNKGSTFYFTIPLEREQKGYGHGRTDTHN